jgi:hypothetical protein
MSNRERRGAIEASPFFSCTDAACYPKIRGGQITEEEMAKWRYLMVSAFALVFSAALWHGPVYSAERLAGVKAGNCGSCHKGQSKLPAGHGDTKAMSYKDCLNCHDKTGPQKLEGKLPASHIHGLSGITCVKCHGKTKKPTEVEMKQCVMCHNAETVASKTAEVKPKNPHTSPHYGTDLDCNLCHHQHRKSENYCSQCHKFDFTVP